MSREKEQKAQFAESYRNYTGLLERHIALVKEHLQSKDVIKDLDRLQIHNKLDGVLKALDTLVKDNAPLTHDVYLELIAQAALKVVDGLANEDGKNFFLANNDKKLIKEKEKYFTEQFERINGALNDFSKLVPAMQSGNKITHHLKTIKSTVMQQALAECGARFKANNHDNLVILLENVEQKLKDFYGEHKDFEAFTKQSAKVARSRMILMFRKYGVPSNIIPQTNVEAYKTMREGELPRERDTLTRTLNEFIDNVAFDEEVEDSDQTAIKNELKELLTAKLGIILDADPENKGKLITEPLLTQPDNLDERVENEQAFTLALGVFNQELKEKNNELKKLYGKPDNDLIADEIKQVEQECLKLLKSNKESVANKVEEDAEENIVADAQNPAELALQGAGEAVDGKTPEERTILLKDNAEAFCAKPECNYTMQADDTTNTFTFTHKTNGQKIIAQASEAGYQFKCPTPPKNNTESKVAYKAMAEVANNTVQKPFKATVTKGTPDQQRMLCIQSIKAGIYVENAISVFAGEGNLPQQQALLQNPKVKKLLSINATLKNNYQAAVAERRPVAQRGL